MTLLAVATLLVGAPSSTLVPPFGSVVKAALVPPGVVIREVVARTQTSFQVVVANERENTVNISLDSSEGAGVAATIPAYSSVSIALPAGMSLCSGSQLFRAHLRIVKQEEAVEPGYVAIQTHSVATARVCGNGESPPKRLEKQDEP